jgi:predicted RNase H-like nuclease (RuvC/YqgF family)
MDKDTKIKNLNNAIEVQQATINELLDMVQGKDRQINFLLKKLESYSSKSKTRLN